MQAHTASDSPRRGRRGRGAYLPDRLGSSLPASAQIGLRRRTYLTLGTVLHPKSTAKGRYKRGTPAFRGGRGSHGKSVLRFAVGSSRSNFLQGRNPSKSPRREERSSWLPTCLFPSWFRRRPGGGQVGCSVAPASIARDRGRAVREPPLRKRACLWPTAAAVWTHLC